MNKLFPQTIRNQHATQKDHLSREGSNSNNNNIDHNNNVNILIPNYQYCSHMMELFCLATEQCYKFLITQSPLHSFITHTQSQQPLHISARTFFNYISQLLQ